MFLEVLRSGSQTDGSLSFDSGWVPTLHERAWLRPQVPLFRVDQIALLENSRCWTNDGSAIPYGAASSLIRLRPKTGGQVPAHCVRAEV